MALSYSNVIDLFVAYCGIAPNSVGAFKARLRHLQRLGFPPGINTGRGRRADYAGEQVLLLGIALEMVELGLSPERAVRIIQNSIPQIAIMAGNSVAELNSNPENPGMMFIWFDPHALVDLQMGNDDLSRDLWAGDHAEALEFIQGLNTLWSRLALVNVTSVVSHVYSMIHHVSPAAAEAFEDEVYDWVARNPLELTDGHS